MPKSTLAGLLFSSLVLWTIGNGLFPLLPGYAAKLGSNPSETGVFLAGIFLALVTGSLIPGLLRERVRTSLVVVIVVGMFTGVGLWVMGTVQSVPLLIASTTVTWFCFGWQIFRIRLFAAEHSSSTERVPVFSYLSATVALGAFLGGSGEGLVAERFGFPILFRSLAVMSLGVWMPICKSVFEIPPDRPGVSADASIKTGTLGRDYWVFTIVTLLSSVVGFCARIGTPLAMHEMKLGPTLVAGTVSVGGAVSLLASFVMPRLVDRFGFYRTLLFIFGLLVVGILLPAASLSLGAFYISAISVSVFFYAGAAVRLAFVASMLPARTLARGMAVFDAASWLAGCIGFIVMGWAVEKTGIFVPFVSCALVGLTAIGAFVWRFATTANNH
jgi:MFS family permease